MYESPMKDALVGVAVCVGRCGVGAKRLSAEATAAGAPDTLSPL